MLIDCHHWTWQQATHARSVLHAGTAAVENSRKRWAVVRKRTEWHKSSTGGKNKRSPGEWKSHLYSLNLRLKVSSLVLLKSAAALLNMRPDYMIFELQDHPSNLAVRVFAPVCMQLASLTRWKTAYFDSTSVVFSWQQCDRWWRKCSRITPPPPRSLLT